MTKAVVYIHGKGGNAAEAERYAAVFNGFDVLGFDYKAETPWEAKDEFTAYFDTLAASYETVYIIANSIGAYFTLNARTNEKIKKAFFISPVTDMPLLITGMMQACGVSEEELCRKKFIETPFGETLSWQYLCRARKDLPEWKVPTHIIYGENDSMIPLAAVRAFAEKSGATLDIMAGGEHWFHTAEQFAFADAVIKKYCGE